MGDFIDTSQNLAKLQASLGHEFRRPMLLQDALRHSSYVHENPDDPGLSNERLEFLGDAVLELCITRLLYTRFPDAQEGQLSKARAWLVNERALAGLARDLDLGPLLLLGRGEELQGGREKPSILADAVEALLAAVYLDAGLEAVDQVIRSLWGGRLDEAYERAASKDYKTRVQELVQEKLKKTPRYQVLDATGPDHAKTFQVALVVGGEKLAQGSGHSKKEAEQRAAAKALAEMEGKGRGQKD